MEFLVVAALIGIIPAVIAQGKGSAPLGSGGSTEQPCPLSLSPLSYHEG